MKEKYTNWNQSLADLSMYLLFLCRTLDAFWPFEYKIQVGNLSAQVKFQKKS